MTYGRVVHVAEELFGGGPVIVWGHFSSTSASYRNRSGFHSP
jgi:hypothetical protein